MLPIVIGLVAIALATGGCSSIDEEENNVSDSGTSPDDAFAADAGGEAILNDVFVPEAVPYNPPPWCKETDVPTETDGPSDYYTKGSVTFITYDGEEITLTDKCKSKILLTEHFCPNEEDINHEDVTKDSHALFTKHYDCECVDGACKDNTVKLCKDPAPDVRIAGASLWIDEETNKAFFSKCLSESINAYHYCNPDGSYNIDFIECAKDVFCGDGMCGGFICTDDEEPGTDPDNQNRGSLELYNPTTGEKHTKLDYCLGMITTSTKVFLFECPLHTATVYSEMISALYHQGKYSDCADGKYCDAGICKERQEICVFDDDEANDTTVKGTIYITNVSGGELSEMVADYCSISLIENPDGTLTPPMDHVWQRDCDDEGVIVQPTSPDQCADGQVCFDGACVFPDTLCDITCTDTDDGQDDIMTGGAIFLNENCSEKKIGMAIDKCISPTELKERYCDGNVPMYIVQECPDGYFCVGAYSYAHCEPCYDSDPSDDPQQLGHVIDAHKTSGDDFCTDDGMLKQAKCNEATGKIDWSDPEPCPPTLTCNEGICD